MAVAEFLESIDRVSARDSDKSAAGFSTEEVVRKAKLLEVLGKSTSFRDVRKHAELSLAENLIFFGRG